jgi:hypothetical protein
MAHFDAITDKLVENGIDRGMILNQSILTPSCGTGSLPIELAEKVFELLASVSTALATRAG